EIRSVRKTIVPSSHQQKMLAVNIAKANKVPSTTITQPVVGNTSSQ
ncbi:21453_t:CDS:1, partial [Racocetra persica]